MEIEFWKQATIKCPFCGKAHKPQSTDRFDCYCGANASCEVTEYKHFPEKFEWWWYHPEYMGA